MITLQLADFIFTHMEIPGSIPLNSGQKIVIHDLPGGARVLDALGKTFEPITWSGLFLGDDAIARAKYLTFLKDQGKPVSLKWSDYSYSVLIQSLNYNFEREYKLPYSITCIVVEDLSSQETTTSAVDVDAELQSDLDMAVTASAVLVDLPEIQGDVSQLEILFKDVKSIVRETQAKIKEIKNRIQDTEKIVTTTIASVNNTLQDVTTLGGVLPNNPVSRNAGKLMGNVKNVNNMVQLMNLKHTLGRMDKNMKTVQTGSTAAPLITVTVANTTLYAVAAKYYKDATLWKTIADYNGLNSPYITTAITITVPGL